MCVHFCSKCTTYPPSYLWNTRSKPVRWRFWEGGKSSVTYGASIGARRSSLSKISRKPLKTKRAGWVTGWVRFGLTLFNHSKLVYEYKRQWIWAKFKFKSLLIQSGSKFCVWESQSNKYLCMNQSAAGAPSARTFLKGWMKLLGPEPADCSFFLFFFVSACNSVSALEQEAWNNHKATRPTCAKVNTRPATYHGWALA